MNIEQAKATGAVALFGEKYDAKVRVLSMGEFSTELCGGTHVNRTGDIGLIKITSEVGIASGIRRIEAVTGERALDLIESNQEKLLAVATLLKAEPDNIKEKIVLLVQKSRQIEKDLEKLKRKLASVAGSDLANTAQSICGINVIASRLEGVDDKSLRDTVDELKNKLAPAAIILSTIEDDKITLIAGVTKDITDKVRAGDLVSHVAVQVGGKGGGRPDMAQGGGNQPDNLASALDSVTGWILSHMES
jgi:alanyl-tRNA synthetase